MHRIASMGDADAIKNTILAQPDPQKLVSTNRSYTSANKIQLQWFSQEKGRLKYLGQFIYIFIYMITKSFPQYFL